ncbi:conserved hypothetical protein [Oleispira antarctica RB-8]|uniref:Porin domain-containing protein n=1 Tax=Oleispira antarctica RB-8 TaxID=698738 RepID=R4YR84_OLEAN|nr:conserved hypothetical protein [Oleispira antarctica RB-8]
MKKSLLALAIAASATAPAYASTAISGGIWLNHQNVLEEDDFNDADQRDQATLGDVNSEALILYIDHQQEGTDWELSAEWRTGPGSFSDGAHNSTGDYSGFHKLWVGYNFSETRKVVIGKSQVPFGWATINFWPGDMALGGYGDQMDVGVKFSDKIDNINYDLAWYISDDFGETSTDTMDDNNHWGGGADTASLYRKVNTAVLNLGYDLSTSQTVGVSYQQGELQETTSVNVGSDDTRDPADDSTFGGHNAWDVWYTGTYGNLGVMAQVMGTQRDGLDNVGALAEEVKTMRQALTVSYATGPFNYYVEYTGASTDTKGNKASDMVAFAPGVSYNYGPGWIYAEYLTQTNYIDSNGDIGDNGDVANTDYKFSAMYLTIDYYF